MASFDIPEKTVPTESASVVPEASATNGVAAAAPQESQSEAAVAPVVRCVPPHG